MRHAASSSVFNRNKRRMANDSMPLEQPQTPKPEEQPRVNQTTEAAPAAEESHNGGKFGCFFKDGVRRIDYVLVWEESQPKLEEQQHQQQEQQQQQQQQQQDSFLDENSLANARHRQLFLANLYNAGMQIERDTMVTAKKRIHFQNLSVTWEAMCYYAEYLRLRVPLRVLNKPTIHQCTACLQRTNPITQIVPNHPDVSYTCVFNASKMENFLGIEDRDTFFTPSQRHLVAQEILGTRVYGDENRCEIGIDRMIEEGIYASAFPLHEGTHRVPEDFALDVQEEVLEAEGRRATDRVEDDFKSVRISAPLNPRQILQTYWVSYRRWYKHQPFDHVREYFGEKIAFYFTWLALYTAWLVPAALAGTIVFLLGFILLHYDTPTIEACNNGKAIKMCPVSEKDGTWNLSEICWKIKLAHLFDHFATAVYAIFAPIWASLLLEFWKRRNSSLAHRWGVTNYRVEGARPRPGYAIGCSQVREDPITGEIEPHFEHWKRLPRTLTGFACLVVMLFVVIGLTVLNILFQSVIRRLLLPAGETLLRPHAKLITAGMSAVCHLFVMIILGYLYERLAYRITEWEMHRTQWKFEDHLIIKLFIFEFFNYYSSLFYIAFFKGRFSGYPGNYIEPLGVRQEECDEGGCLWELAVTMAIIMIGRQIVATLIDVLISKVCLLLHRRRLGLWLTSEQDGLKPWESDYSLLPFDGLMYSYREVILQFGFVTLFVAAFPLAPLFAMLRNLIRIRMDAGTLVSGSRRPLPERSQGLGNWFGLLQFVSAASVITNAFLIAFTSDLLPRLLYMFEVRGDLRGYINFTLAWSPPNVTSEPCRYRSFRDPNGKFTEFHWKLLVAQLAFVVVFERVVHGIRSLVMVLVPSEPKELRKEINRQGFLGKQALIDVISQPQRRESQTEYSFRSSIFNALKI